MSKGDLPADDVDQQGVDAEEESPHATVADAADNMADHEQSEPEQSADNNASVQGDAPGAESETGTPAMESGELGRLRDQLARARADYNNLERRTQQTLAIEKERVKARFLEGFLQVYEYGQMAAQEAEKTPGPLAEGIKMVVAEFDRLLETEGVERIGVVGEPFDGNCHEAVADEEGDSPGQVARVVRPGYRLGERVLQFARVVVTK